MRKMVRKPITLYYDSRVILSATKLEKNRFSGQKKSCFSCVVLSRSFQIFHATLIDCSSIGSEVFQKGVLFIVGPAECSMKGS